jgi:peptide/nickel transport system substrate-binding protein
MSERDRDGVEIPGSGGVSRRRMLRAGLLVTGSLAVGGLLQACGGSGQAPPNPPTAAPAAKPTDAPKPAESKPAEAAKPAAEAKPAAAASPATQAAPAVKPAESPMAAPAAAGTPKRGGTLIVAKTTEAPSLEPHAQNALSRSRVTQHLYSYLVQNDKNMGIVPDLAEKWDISQDGKTYNFALRKGVKFHNGRELTSADVKYSLERILDPKTASQGAGLLSSIDGVETPDPYTARVVLKNPDAAILASLASNWSGIVAREEVDKAGGLLDKVAGGSGPYMLEEWIPNQTLKLKRNPSYYVQGQPYLDAITFQVIPEESNIIAQLRSGAVHLALLEDNKNYQLVQNDQSLTVTRSPRLGYDYVNLDNKREPWTKLEARQALSYAIDRKEVLAVAASNLGAVVAPVPPALKEFALDPDTLPEYKPDVNKAKELLAKAGYPNGLKVELELIPTFPTMVTGAQVIADQARKAGIEFELKQYEYGVWIKRFNEKQFVTTMNITGGNADPDSLLYNRISSKGVNQNNWQDEEVDRLLQQGKEAVEPGKRKEIYTQLQKVLATKVPQIWLYSADLIHVMKKSVRGYDPHPSTFYNGLVTTWLEG